jgi:REP element-mobilizing transposase RayT
MLKITERNLPHWTTDGAIYWVTFRMADSLPQEKLKFWKTARDAWTALHPEPWSKTDWREYDKLFGEQFDKWLDAGFGSQALANRQIREVVHNALLCFHGQRHELHNAVIMPTHVHLLIRPFSGEQLSELLKGLKGSSARKVNVLLKRTGAFWMEESYDHIVRNEEQYRYYHHYIRTNPARAGLRSDEYWLMSQG